MVYSIKILTSVITICTRATLELMPVGILGTMALLEVMRRLLPVETIWIWGSFSEKSFV